MTKKLKKKIGIMVVIVIICGSVDFAIKKYVEETVTSVYDKELHGKLKPNQYLLHFRNADQNDELILSTEIVVIENFWTIFYTRNYNVGFSFLSFLENYFPAYQVSSMLKYFQLFGVLIILYLFYSYNFNYSFSFVLVIAGGIGNVIDRFIHGYVIDYIKWSIPNSPIKLFDPWPIFNLADVFVSVGGISFIIILISEMVVQGSKKGNREN